MELALRAYCKNRLYLGGTPEAEDIQGLTVEIIEDEFSRYSQILANFGCKQSIVEVLCAALLTNPVFVIKIGENCQSLCEYLRDIHKENYKTRTKIFKKLSTKQYVGQICRSVQVTEHKECEVYGDQLSIPSKITLQGYIMQALEIICGVNPFTEKLYLDIINWPSINYIDIIDYSKTLKLIDFPFTTVKNLLLALGFVYDDLTAVNSGNFYCVRGVDQAIIWNSDRFSEYYTTSVPNFIHLFEHDLISSLQPGTAEGLDAKYTCRKIKGLH